MKDIKILNQISGAGGKGGGDQRIPQEAPNTLRSYQTVSTVEVLSEGPVKGLIGDPDLLKGVLFDKTPVQSQNGDYNFSGVTAQFREGLPSQEPMSGFPGTEDIFSVNVELLNENSVIRTIDSNADAVRIIITLPNGLSLLDEENGDLEGYRVEFTVDTRPLGGTWTEAFTHEISGKSVTSYSEAHRVERPDTAGDWEVRIRRRTEFQDSSRVTESIFVSSIVEITDTDISYDDAAVVGLSVDAESTGGSIPVRSFLVDGLKLQVPDNYEPTVYNSDGTVQSYAFYDGTWDGLTFKEEFTDDPAWIAFNMLWNDRWGLNISETDIDINSFFEASQYNMELIPKSVQEPSVLEPRFTFNGVISTRQDPYETIQSIASNCRAVVFSSGGLVKLIQDRPTEPIAVINQSNVIDGLFTYSSTEKNDRFTSVNVTYNDIENRYNPRTINERASLDNIQQFGLNLQELNVIGVVRESQARRIARWALESTISNTDIVNFSVGWNQSLVDVGEVFYLADNDFANIQFSGKVSQITGTVGSQSIKVDRDVSTLTLPANIVLLSTSGTELIVQIDSFSNSDTLVTSTGSDLTDFTNGEFIITNADISPRQFKVTGISERQGNGILDITAVEFDPAKFDRVEQGINIDEPPDIFDGSEIDKPSGLDANIESVITPNDTIRFRVRLTWNDSTDPLFSHYLVRWRRNANQYTQSNELTQSQFIIDDALPGFYEVMVNSVNSRNVMSAPAVENFLVDIDGQVSPIGPIQNLELVSGGFIFNDTQFTIQWTEPTVLNGETIKDYLVSLILDDGNNTPAKIFVAEDTQLQITRADVIEAYGEAIRDVRISVEARDSLNRISDDTVIETFTNPAPAALTTISSTPQIGSYKVDHEDPLEDDAEGIKIWHSTTTGFTPTRLNLVKDDVGNSHIVEAAEDTTYFYVIAAYDSWTRDVDKLNFSLEQSVTTNFEIGDPPPPADPLQPTPSSNINTLINGTQVADIIITWGKVTDVNSYDLEIFEDGVLWGIPVVSQPDGGSTVSFQLNGDIGKEYCFRVRSRNGSVISDWSTQSCITQGEDTSSSAVPTGISTSPRFEGALVQWINPTDNNFAATEIWRKLSGALDSSAIKVGEASKPVNVFFDFGLNLGTAYQYRVRSVTVAGELSNYSAWSTVTPSNVPDNSIGADQVIANSLIASDVISDGTITGNLISATDIIISNTAQLGDATISSAKLQGTIQSDNFVSGSQGWQITRDLGTAEFGEAFIRGDLITGVSPDFRTEITRPDNSNDYVLWSGSGTKTDANGVFWVKANGTSIYTGQLDGSIGPGVNVPGDQIDVGNAPAVPSGLAVTASSTILPGASQVADFDISWDSEVGAETYEVEIRRAGVVQIILTVPGTNANYRGDVGISHGFRVRSLNEFGVRSAWSNQISRTVSTNDGAPGKPFGLSSADVYQGAILSWTNTSSSNLKSIEIWRRVGFFGTSSKIGEIAAPGNVFVDDGLTIGSTYRYKVRSVSIGGQPSAFTGETVVTAQNVPGGSIDTPEIATLAITGTHISDNAISTPKLQANVITSNEIAAGSVTASEIAAGSVTASEIAAGSITGSEIAAGSITGSEISANSITGNNISSNTITANELSTGELITNSAQIGDAIITSAKIAGTIESDNYVSGSSGWAIDRNLGTAEFGNVIARGNLQVSSASGQKVELKSVGNFRIWVGPSTTNLNSDTDTTIENEGIFWVKNDGTAKINKNVFDIPEGGGGFSVTSDNADASDAGFSDCNNISISTTIGETNTSTQGATGTVSYQWSHISTSQGPTPTIFGSTSSNARWSVGSGQLCDSTNFGVSSSTWKVTATDSGSGLKAESIIGVLISWANLQ